MRKLNLIIWVILWGNIAVLAQPADFEYIKENNKIIFNKLQAKSIEIDIRFDHNKHCSVRLIKTDHNGNIESQFIGDDMTISIDPSQIQSFVIIHRKKMFVRFRQNIEVSDDSTILPRSSRKSLFKSIFGTGRVRLSSQTMGGTTTTTTITST